MTIAEQILPDFMLRICEFLATPLIDNGIIVLHIWSIIHFGVGALLFYFVRKEKYALLVVFVFLVLFEIFEFSISYLFPIILKETFLDTFFDLVVGIVGALIAYIFLKIKE